MGRRPNAISATFFERGAKLDDNSNRYCHTCKRCGELFPKGRVDSLTAHLLRKCRSATQEDRDWVFLQLQQAPQRPPRTRTQPVRDDSNSEASFLAPPPDYHHPSALDTLAEVSRHHLDYSGHYKTNDNSHDLNEALDERSFTELQLIAHLREFAEQSNNQPSTGHQNVGNDQSFESTQHNFDPATSTAGASDFPASGLVETASAANQQLEASQLPQHPQLDPHLEDMTDIMYTPAAEQSDPSFMHGSWRPPYDPAQALAHPDRGMLFGLPHSAKKVRGQFDASRRKEVADLRKFGACLRCRMLKKPCSGETPCSTCRKVGSPRQWKDTCIRRRISEEFTLWSTKLFWSRSVLGISAACHGLQPVEIPGRIKVHFGIAPHFAAAFEATIFARGLDPAVVQDPALAQIAVATVVEDNERILVLRGDTGSELTIEKLELCLENAVDQFIEQDSSPFMVATLQHAQLLAAAEGVESHGNDNISQSPRSCYALQQHLVKNVIELWVLTKLLVSSKMRPTVIRYSPKSADGPVQESSGTDVPNDGGARDIPSSSTSYGLISAQLYAAIERRCGQLGKTVMGELEHRLLRRKQADHLNTFISAVILLNCVERTTGLYYSFDANLTTSEPAAPNSQQQQQQQQQSTNNDNSTQDSQSSRHNDTSWPITPSPSQLWRQGPRFAALLTMLLHIRGLPPKTTQTDTGILSVAPNLTPSGTASPTSAAAPPTTATAWLNPLNLNTADLLAKRDSNLPSAHDAVEEAWDMRFIAGILLAERIGGTN